jgi:hypothetical protein
MWTPRTFMGSPRRCRSASEADTTISVSTRCAVVSRAVALNTAADRPEANREQAELEAGRKCGDVERGGDLDAAKA